MKNDKQQPESLKNWTEDYPHENGQYDCKCAICGNLFIGHKRRVTCRECARGPEVPLSNETKVVESVEQYKNGAIITIDGKKFPFAQSLKNQNGLKSDIIKLVLNLAAPDDDCMLSDFLHALQYVLDSHASQLKNTNSVKVIVQAQTVDHQPKETPIYIKITPSQLNALQQVLQYSFQWLPKSSAPSNEVQQVLEVTKQIFPVLVADSTKRAVTTPPVKKK